MTRRARSGLGGPTPLEYLALRWHARQSALEVAAAHAMAGHRLDDDGIDRLTFAFLAHRMAAFREENTSHRPTGSPEPHRRGTRAASTPGS